MLGLAPSKNPKAEYFLYPITKKRSSGKALEMIEEKLKKSKKNPSK